MPARSAGELIGRSGMTGRSTGPHLHLEAFKDGKRIDPQHLLDEPLEDHALRQALDAKRNGDADAVYSAPRISAKAGKYGKRARHGGGKAAMAKAPTRAKAAATKSAKRVKRG